MIVALLLQIPKQAGPARPAARVGPDPVVRVFATGNGSPTFSHVVVGLARIVMTGAGGDRIVFRSKPGRRIDLASLSSQEGGRLAFLTRKVVPAGVYDGFRIELDEDVEVEVAGSSTPVAAKFGDTRFGFKRIDVEFPAPSRFEANRNVSLDFDLSHWTLKGTVLTVQTETDPETKRTQQTGLDFASGAPYDDLDRQIPQTLTGFVTGPIGRGPAPLIGFRQEGWILPVRFVPPRPKRGEVLKVTGKFSPAQDAFVASDYRPVTEKDK